MKDKIIFINRSSLPKITLEILKSYEVKKLSTSTKNQKMV